jgi:hypothetical protein
MLRLLCNRVSSLYKVLQITCLLFHFTVVYTIALLPNSAVVMPTTCDQLFESQAGVDQ